MKIDTVRMIDTVMVFGGWQEVVVDSVESLCYLGAVVVVGMVLVTFFKHQ